MKIESQETEVFIGSLARADSTLISTGLVVAIFPHFRGISDTKHSTPLQPNSGLAWYLLLICDVELLLRVAHRLELSMFRAMSQISYYDQPNPLPSQTERFFGSRLSRRISLSILLKSDITTGRTRQNAAQTVNSSRLESSSSWPSSNLQNALIPGKKSPGISAGTGEPFNGGKQSAHFRYTARQDGDADRFSPISMNWTRGWLAEMKDRPCLRRRQVRFHPPRRENCVILTWDLDCCFLLH